MPHAEQMIRKAESLPPNLFEEVDHYIDYLSQKAHTAYVAEKISKAGIEMAKPDIKWINEEEFWEEYENFILYNSI